MSDDIRMALQIPIPVNTMLGVVPVRTLSAVEFVMFGEQAVGIGRLVQAEAAEDGDVLGAIQRVLVKYSTRFVGLFSGATGLTAEQLGSLPLDEFLDIGIAFLDQHEKSIARFFDLKRRWEDLAVKIRPSRNSSTRLSVVDGRTPTSETSASTISKSTEGPPPSVESRDSSIA